MNSHNRVLELNKVLEKIAEYAVCDDARDSINNTEISNEISTVSKLLSETSSAHSAIQRYNLPPFHGLNNIDLYLKKAEMGSTLTITEILKVKSVLRTIRLICSWKEQVDFENDSLTSYFQLLTPNKYIEDIIEKSITSDEEISDNASPLLSDIRRKIHSNEVKIKDLLYKYIHNPKYTKYLQDAIITSRNGRYVIPVKNEYRTEIPGLVHDTSSSGATLFIEPLAVVEGNNKINILKKEETLEIERILSEISSFIGSFSDNISKSYALCVKLNVIFSKAQYSLSINGEMPKLNSDGFIDLRKARHPLLKPSETVPINIVLGKDYKSLIITGPNTGGKTVTIKTIGLLTLMTMCGILIPTESGSSIAIFDNIFSDIGDEQSIEQSLSTFSSHLTNIISITENVTANSLVLIDELGAGTDPVEGAALAISILEFLRNKGAVIAATTHYPELKEYALMNEGVINGCCEFDVKTLKPTYKLLIGIPGKSNAFSIAKQLGLNESIINFAKDRINLSHSNLEDIIEKLNENRITLERKIAETEEIKKKVEQELLSVNAERKSLESKADREIADARKKAEQITRTAKFEAEKLLNEIELLRKELSKGEGSIHDIARRAKAEINKDLDAIEDIIETEKETKFVEGSDNKSINIGDIVIIKSLDSEGVITGAKDKNGFYCVQIGTFKTKVKENDIYIKQQQTAKSKSSQNTSINKHVNGPSNAQVKTELDLRGMNIEEGILELDSFIDHCLRMNLRVFTVIHGKGTGVLRNGIRMYLKKNKWVKSFRPGNYGEGEDGVSIVTLK